MFYSVGLEIHDMMALITTTGESHLLRVERLLQCQILALKVLFEEGGKQRSFTAAQSKP
jgi:hypothetical protein